MYFPQKPIQVEDFFRNIEYYSDEQKLCIIEDLLKQLRFLPDTLKNVANYEIDCILNRYKEILMRQRQIDADRVKNLAESDITLETKLSDILEELHKRDEGLSLIVSDVKPFKNLYIFIISHPLNSSNVIAEILSRINYLDKMTRDVTFVMPGYKRAEKSDEICNAADHYLQLTFDENIFIEMIQDLENKSNGKFVYNDECELLIVGMTADGNYDFGNYARLNLNELSTSKHIDAVRLIMSLAQNFRMNLNGCINIKDFISGVRKSNEKEMQSYNESFYCRSKKTEYRTSVITRAIEQDC